MGFRLTPIFIKSEAPKSDEEVLMMVGLLDLKKGRAIDFYDTNKQYENIFLGTKEHCKILCNGALAYKAFEDKHPFLHFNQTEIASIIWDETSDTYGFCLIKDGEIIRKVMVSDRVIAYDVGHPIQEETAMKDDEIFMPEEMEEIIEYEGEEGFKELVKAEKVCRAANDLAKRYIGAGIVEIQEKIELNEYE